jgi:hypothetical protein
MIGAVVYLIIYGLGAAKRRREALAKVASDLSLRFTEADPYGLAEVYGAAAFCSEGHDRKAYNVISGTVSGGDVRFFDYEYTVTVTRTHYVSGSKPGEGHWETTTEEETSYKSACAFHAGYSFKKLFVRPESFLDKAAAFVGFEDIDLDFAEFNKSFYVASDDKKFAYAVLTQKAMEFFLARAGITMEMLDDYTLFYYGSGVIAAEEVPALIATAAEFSSLLPEYLKKELVT